MQKQSATHQLLLRNKSRFAWCPDAVNNTNFSTSYTLYCKRTFWANNANKRIAM